MTYREEVESALASAINETGSLRELILLGVRLGLEAAAVRAEELYCAGEYSSLVQDEIRDIHHGSVLQVQR